MTYLTSKQSPEDVLQQEAKQDSKVSTEENEINGPQFPKKVNFDRTASLDKHN